MNVELASGHGQGMVIDAVRYEGNDLFLPETSLYRLMVQGGGFCTQIMGSCCCFLISTCTRRKKATAPKSKDEVVHGNPVHDACSGSKAPR
ncbi:hypothetical protein GE21DRAFT_1280141 [Neurospora crassa]|nr:hypothetical protein GE21DRAFT_1280141 [Neurospora crassa]